MVFPFYADLRIKETSFACRGRRGFFVRLKYVTAVECNDCKERYKPGAQKTMDKTEIIEELNRFPYSKKDYWVLTGGAMVLYGIKEQTSDIDLGCSLKLADELERDGFFFRFTESGRRHFKYEDNIEIFENWIKDTVTLIENVPVVTIPGLIEMKRELGREKDSKDLDMIYDYLKHADPGCPE